MSLMVLEKERGGFEKIAKKTSRTQQAKGQRGKAKEKRSISFRLALSPFWPRREAPARPEIVAKMAARYTGTIPVPDMDVEGRAMTATEQGERRKAKEKNGMTTLFLPFPLSPCTARAFREHADKNRQCTL